MQAVQFTMVLLRGAVTTVKITACSLISTPELMLRAKNLTSMSFLPMHLYLLVGVMYFMMAFPLSMIARRVEAYMARGRK